MLSWGEVSALRAGSEEARRLTKPGGIRGQLSRRTSLPLTQRSTSAQECASRKGREGLRADLLVRNEKVRGSNPLSSTRSLDFESSTAGPPHPAPMAAAAATAADLLRARG